MSVFCVCGREFCSHILFENSSFFEEKMKNVFSFLYEKNGLGILRITGSNEKRIHHNRTCVNRMFMFFECFSGFELPKQGGVH